MHFFFKIKSCLVDSKITVLEEIEQNDHSNYLIRRAGLRIIARFVHVSSDLIRGFDSLVMMILALQLDVIRFLLYTFIHFYPIYGYIIIK